MQYIDFTLIVRRSLDMVRRYQTLWWLGILAALGQGAGGSVPNIPGNNDLGNSPHEFPSDVAWIDRAKESLVGRIFDDHRMFFLVGALVIVAFLFWLGYVSFVARASLIMEIDRVEKEEETAHSKHKQLHFQEAYQKGKPQAWRLIGFSCLLSLYILAAVTVFGVLIAGAIYAGNQPNLSSITWVLGLLATVAGVGLFLGAFYVSVYQRLGERAVVLRKGTVVEAMRFTYQLTLNQRSNVTSAWLVNLGVSLVIVFVSFAALLIAGGLLTLIGYLVLSPLHIASPLAGNQAGLVYSLLGLGAVLITAFGLLLSGLISAFTSSYWTMTYRALDYLARA